MALLGLGRHPSKSSGWPRAAAQVCIALVECQQGSRPQYLPHSKWQSDLTLSPRIVSHSAASPPSTAPCQKVCQGCWVAVLSAYVVESWSGALEGASIL